MSWLIDAHVHYHPCFGWRRFLSAAADNFDAEANSRDDLAEAGVLLFVETEGEDQLGAFAREPRLPPGWSASPLEGIGVRVDRPGGTPLLLLRGRQLATRERLEVLALVSGDPLPDGLSLQESVRRALDAGACVAIPWGFGKWWSSRGALLREFLEGPLGASVHLGDNANRAAGWPTPAILRDARDSAKPVLPGSDPLPFESHARRAAGFGFWLEAPLDLERPAESLKRALGSHDAKLRPYGRLRSAAGFVVDQLRMQWVARRRDRTPGERS